MLLHAAMNRVTWPVSVRGKLDLGILSLVDFQCVRGGFAKGCLGLRVKQVFTQMLQGNRLRKT